MEAAEDARSWQDSRANGGHRTEMASGSAFQYSTLATLVETPLPPAPTSFLHPLAPSPLPHRYLFLRPLLVPPLFAHHPSNVRSLSFSSVPSHPSRRPGPRNPLVSVLRSFYFLLRILRFRSLPDFSSPSAILEMRSSFRETDDALGKKGREKFFRRSVFFQIRRSTLVSFDKAPSFTRMDYFLGFFSFSALA